ncbi:MAG TPA: DUF1178 family protein [Novosphingobium sp.]|nr:DUF1178 family protein [Novosphingobium sp.]
MIVFDLECLAARHRFEGWFGSSGDFEDQRERGLLTCPACGSGDVAKALMAPAVGRKGNQLGQTAKAPVEQLSNQPMPPEAAEMMRQLAKIQAEALRNSRWVGQSFAEDARAMHYGEREVETIHGQATIAEAKELFEEGIGVAPLPFPVVSPDEAN